MNDNLIFCSDVKLLTEAEAIVYLRLDVDKFNKADPRNTLRYYRNIGKLKATKIGKHLFYSKKELDRFIEVMTG